MPDGVDLTPSDSIEITEDGAVVDAMEVTGKVTVRANNVTITRSKIVATSRYAIEIDSGYENLIVEDTEIDGNDGTSTIAILRGEYTLRRANIHSVQDGPRIEGDNVVIEDSYIHSLHRVPDGHHDTVQIRQGSNVVIQRNTLQAYNAVGDDPMNASIQFGSQLGVIADMHVNGNYMNGGNYTLNGGIDDGHAVFRDNRFGRDFRYGVMGLSGNVSFDSSNVYDDTGEPVQ